MDIEHLTDGDLVKKKKKDLKLKKTQNENVET